MSMADKIKSRINELCTHMLFEFKGVDCGVDPLSRDHFDMWYGKESFTAKSIDEVMSTPFFNGHCLNDIAESVEITDW